MKKYDLHAHTCYSKCSSLLPEKLLSIAKASGLDGIAVTDHDTINGALAVKKLNKCRSFEVVVGEEITTNYGDVLALYVKKEIKPGNIHRVLADIKKQDCIAIVPHPFTFFSRRTFSYKKFLQVKDRIDGIECFNGRASFFLLCSRIREIARRNCIAITGGSDSHFGFELGSAATLFDGKLRQAIKERATTVIGKKSLLGFIGYVLSGLYKRLKWLGI